jgi:predicted transcriptional regulator
MVEIAVLISIKPKWVNLILSGKKTIEIRKTIPKLAPPFTCYIYESGTGCVVGEFVCTKTEYYTNHQGRYLGSANIPPKSCVNVRELIDYAGETGVGFAWHISSVKEYETPLTLSAFQIACTQKTPCNECQLWNNGRYQIPGCALANIEKPPQSWRYVQRRTK